LLLIFLPLFLSQMFFLISFSSLSPTPISPFPFLSSHFSTLCLLYSPYFKLFPFVSTVILSLFLLVSWSKSHGHNNLYSLFLYMLTYTWSLQCFLVKTLV
jgi:hypothetical protein